MLQAKFKRDMDSQVQTMAADFKARMLRNSDDHAQLRRQHEQACV